MLYGNLNLPLTYYPFATIPVFREALDWLHQMRPDQPEGIFELRGPNMYINVHSYPTLPRAECTFESHQRYIDLQYCIAGGELIDYCRTDWLTPASVYDPARDFAFFKPPSSYSTVRMAPGDFAVFFPPDGHRPKVANGQDTMVRKLVVKIAVELLPPSS